MNKIKRNYNKKQSFHSVDSIINKIISETYFIISFSLFILFIFENYVFCFFPIFLNEESMRVFLQSLNEFYETLKLIGLCAYN